VAGHAFDGSASIALRWPTSLPACFFAFLATGTGSYLRRSARRLLRPDDLRAHSDIQLTRAKYGATAEKEGDADTAAYFADKQSPNPST